MKENQELYNSPEVNVVEIKARRILCSSQREAGNEGYESSDYEW